MVVAKATWNRSAAGEVVRNKGADHIALKAGLLVDDVVGDTQRFRDMACVIDVVDRATASPPGLGHAVVAGEAALVPELQGEADQLVALFAQHGCDGGGIDSSRHGNGDDVVCTAPFGPLP